MTGHGGPGIAKTAQEHPTHRLGTLDEWRNEPCLHAGGRDIRQAAASGVDRLSAQADARPLEETMDHLVERRKRKRDRAKRVRRRSSPNGDGQRRP